MKNVKLKNLRPGDIIMKTQVFIQKENDHSWEMVPLRVRGVVGHFLFVDYIGVFDKWVPRAEALNFTHGEWVRVPAKLVEVKP